VRQAEAVAVAAHREGAGMTSLELQRDGGDDLLQLATARACERMVVGCIARREGIDEALHPDCEVGDG
jgi:hypothetical protein